MSFSIVAMAGATPLERIAEWYQNSVIAEILNYLSERYFSVDFRNYENISMSSGAGVTARNLIVAVACGFIIAFLITAYTRVVLGGFVRKLNTEQCNTPATAKTLFELGYFRNASIRSALTKGTALRMVVRSCTLDEREEAKNAPVTEDACAENANEDTAAPSDNAEGESAEETAETAAKTKPRMQTERIDFVKTAFYIPEDLRIRSDIRFEKRGSGWLPVILAIVATVVVAALLCWLLPDLVQFADNLITVFAPE